MQAMKNGHTRKDGIKRKIYAPSAACNNNITNAVFSHTDGLDNERLSVYFASVLFQMKKRHERGVVPRPDWCSPTRWRMFAAWYRSRNDARVFIAANNKQETDPKAWQKQIKSECAAKRRKVQAE